MDSLPGYDAWKLASPEPDAECPKCGSTDIEVSRDDDATCQDCGYSECCYGKRCYCGHPDV